MPVPARCWPAEGSCASGKPGRPCPTCRIETNRVRRPSKTSDLRSDALSRQPSRHRCPTCRSKTNRVSRPSKPSEPRSDTPTRQPSRHRSRPLARSRSRRHRVLAVAPPVRRPTVCAREHPELSPTSSIPQHRATRASGGIDAADARIPCDSGRLHVTLGPACAGRRGSVWVDLMQTFANTRLRWLFARRQQRRQRCRSWAADGPKSAIAVSLNLAGRGRRGRRRRAVLFSWRRGV